MVGRSTLQANILYILYCCVNTSLIYIHKMSVLHILYLKLQKELLYNVNSDLKIDILVTPDVTEVYADIKKRKLRRLMEIDYTNSSTILTKV